MRKKPGYRQLALYLTDQQFAQLERYWRLYTNERHISYAAVALLQQALQEQLTKQELEREP